MLASIFSLNVIQTALELGCIYGLVALALFLSYSILNIADLSTDGCFTLGAAVGAAVASSAQSILVSGVSFFASTFGVGLYSNVDIISSMCSLIARGALCSVVVVLFLLPAVLLVLVLIIGQVVFSGVMFSMTGALTAISYIIVCRWGMGALGASTDLNDRLSWLKAGLDSPMYDATVPNLVHSWQMLGLITLVCVAAAWLVLYIGFNRKKG